MDTHIRTKGIRQKGIIFTSVQLFCQNLRANYNTKQLKPESPIIETQIKNNYSELKIHQSSEINLFVFWQGLCRVHCVRVGVSSDLQIILRPANRSLLFRRRTYRQSYFSGARGVLAGGWGLYFKLTRMLSSEKKTRTQKPSLIF